MSLSSKPEPPSNPPTMEIRFRSSWVCSPNISGFFSDITHLPLFYRFCSSHTNGRRKALKTKQMARRIRKKLYFTDEGRKLFFPAFDSTLLGWNIRRKQKRLAGSNSRFLECEKVRSIAGWIPRICSARLNVLRNSLSSSWPNEQSRSLAMHLRDNQIGWVSCGNTRSLNRIWMRSRKSFPPVKPLPGFCCQSETILSFAFIRLTSKESQSAHG